MPGQGGAGRNVGAHHAGADYGDLIVNGHGTSLGSNPNLIIPNYRKSQISNSKSCQDRKKSDLAPFSGFPPARE
jgi:hypothetical protein